jgi:hypothetical protein
MGFRWAFFASTAWKTAFLGFFTAILARNRSYETCGCKYGLINALRMHGERQVQAAGFGVWAVGSVSGEALGGAHGGSR